MIKIAKKQSYKDKSFLPSLRNFFLKRITVIVLPLFLYIFLPLYLTIRLNPAVKLLLLFYLVNILVAFYLLRLNSGKKYRLSLKAEELEGKINILNDENSRDPTNQAGLQEKISRYDNLKNIIEKINHNLDLESIADTLADVSFSLIGNNRGVCNLYLVDSQTYILSLFKTKKEDENLIIKTKEGDIFDLWVLRHTSPLLIEDTRQDFRFDSEKLKIQYARPISSLISSPLVSEHKFLGVLRLDNPTPSFYSQDDLRLLVAICDFGSVALESGQLFQKTQDLATHDGLTSLYTKGYFLERLKEECKRSVRQNNPFSLLMLDIDYFKKYNDKFGHTAGDILLKNLSRYLAESLKDYNPIISRFGGEEFCVILPGIDKKKASLIAEKLRVGIEKAKVILRMQETSITVSIGVTSSPADSSDKDELVFKADRAMYGAKQKGRNRVCST